MIADERGPTTTSRADRPALLLLPPPIPFRDSTDAIEMQPLALLLGIDVIFFFSVAENFCPGVPLLRNVECPLWSS
jgi:hypothetical protein